MRAEQGDVEVIRELRHIAGELDGWRKDRILATAVALERAERDAKFWKYEQTEASKELLARAEKAERALAEMREPLRKIARFENHNREETTQHRIARAAMNALTRSEGVTDAVATPKSGGGR